MSTAAEPAGSPGSAEPAGPAGPLSRAGRGLLLGAVAACAACGLIYELVLLTLATSLVGGGITQTSLIVAGFVAALGVGALLVKPFLSRPASTFVIVEVALALLGGFSAAVLYVTFAYFGVSTPVLVVGTAVIGILVGAEVPLLMTLLQSGRGRITASSSGNVLADLNAADYAGALLGGVLWPFVLLPLAGLISGAALTGLVNLLAAGFVAFVLLRGLLSRRTRILLGVALAVAALVLGGLILNASAVQDSSRQRLYADPVIAAQLSQYQDVVLTRRGSDTRLYLDGDLQFSSVDEYRYTESLVFPALAGGARRVLILGGGDGLAARDVLRTPGVASVVQVELDPAVLELARTRLAWLNGGSLTDPRMRIVQQDAFAWLRGAASGAYDAVIIDMPDPDTPALGRLYTTEFYGLAARVLRPGGRLTVQAGSPYSTPTAYWRTVATLRSAGLGVRPYHVHVPSFGDWGFALAQHGSAVPALQIPRPAPPLRFLDEDVLAAATSFGRDRPAQVLEPSTLDRPRIVDDLRAGYQG